MWLEACLPDFWWKFAIAAIAYVYNYIFVEHFKWKTFQEIFMSKKPKISHFYVFDCRAYMFFSGKVCANELGSHSELIYMTSLIRNSIH